MPDETPQAENRPKGLFCPTCHGTRLTVLTVQRPCPGKVVRYRVCSACNGVLITEEMVAKGRKAKKAKQAKPNRPAPAQRLPAGGAEKSRPTP